MLDLAAILGNDNIFRHGDLGEPEALTLPAFWRAVNVLSGTWATLPRHVYRGHGEYRDRAEHPANALLGLRANRHTPAIVLDETTMSHALVYGNGYQQIERDQRGRPIGRHLLNPESVEPVIVNGERLYIVDDGERASVVANRDCIHIPGLGGDGLKGYPIVRLMSEALAVGRDLQRHSRKLAERGTLYGLSLELPGEMAEDKLERMLAGLRDWRSDPERIPILRGGAKLANNAINPDDAKLIESREFSVTDVCRILGVPPHMVFQMGRATWSNAETLGRELATYSLRPWVVKSEQELTLKLLSRQEQESGLYISTNMDALLRGDPESKTDNIIKLYQSDLLDRDEARALLERGPGRTSRTTKSQSPPGSGLPEDNAKLSRASLGEPEDGPHAAEPERLSLALVEPAIRAACDRVDRKLAKARKPDLPTHKLNVLAETQAGYAKQELGPLVALGEAAGLKLNLSRIAARYDLAIKRGGPADLYAIATSGEDNAESN